MDKTLSFSTVIFFTPKQHTAFVSPLSCKLRTSKMPSTKIMLECMGCTAGNKGSYTPFGLVKYFGLGSSPSDLP